MRQCIRLNTVFGEFGRLERIRQKGTKTMYLKFQFLAFNFDDLGHEIIYPVILKGFQRRRLALYRVTQCGAINVNILQNIAKSN